MKRLVFALCAMFIGTVHCQETEYQSPQKISKKTAKDQSEKSEESYFNIKAFTEPAKIVVNVLPAPVLAATPEWDSPDVIVNLPEKVDSEWEIAAGVGTLILGFATLLLWRETRRLVKEGAETSRHQLRAYVLPRKATFARTAGLSVVQVECQNYGQTPAYYCTNWINAVIREYPLDSELLLKRRNAAGFMAPGVPYYLRTHSNIKLTSEQVKAIREGTKAIYVYGEITYFDIYMKDIWITRFRFVSVDEHFKEERFRIAEAGNYADVERQAIIQEGTWKWWVRAWRNLSPFRPQLESSS
jgi:hypothetical protein